MGRCVIAVLEFLKRKREGKKKRKRKEKEDIPRQNLKVVNPKLKSATKKGRKKKSLSIRRRKRNIRRNDRNGILQVKVTNSSSEWTIHIPQHY